MSYIRKMEDMQELQQPFEWVKNILLRLQLFFKRVNRWWSEGVVHFRFSLSLLTNGEPESHHGLIWVISSSDLWALWVRFWHVRRGYGSCCALNSLFAYIRCEFGLLPLFPLQYFYPELSVSNYSKSAVLLILKPSWKKHFLKGFDAG